MRIKEKFLEWKESSLFEKVFSALFAGAIMVALLTRVVCIRDTKNYDQLQPELRFPDVIADVLYDEELGQIYVCYNDASYVNVYTEDGEFLWAVSTPYQRNVDFALMDGKLLVNGFAYDAADGIFLELLDENTEILLPEWEEDDAVSYDAYQVYRGTETIVSRPSWYWLTNFVVCWCIAMGSGLLYGGIVFVAMFVQWCRTRKQARIENGKGRGVLGYWKFKCALQGIWSVANVIAACYGRDITIGTIAVVVHFIVSGWVLTNLFEKLDTDEDQDRVLAFWHVCDWATVIVAFASVLVAQAVLGNL